MDVHFTSCGIFFAQGKLAVNAGYSPGVKNTISKHDKALENRFGIDDFLYFQDSSRQS